MKKTTIGEIAYLVSKGTTPTSIGLQFSNRGIPFLRGEDVLGDIANLSRVKMFIDERSQAVLSRSALMSGDVLVTIAGTIGRTAYLGDDCNGANCNQAVAFIRLPLDIIDPCWLSSLLYSPAYQAKFGEFVAGGAIPNVNLEQIKSLEIPLIEIEEQRQIAAKLKSQLAEVETARQAAQLQAKEINQVLNEVIEFQIAKALSSSSNLIKLSEVSSITAKIVQPNQDDYENLPHVSAENIESVTGRLMNIRSAKEDGMTSGKYLFDAGDILYSKLRPYLRKVAKPDFNGLCSADMYPIKADDSLLNMDFLKLLLTSNLFTEYANEKSARSRMPKLNREQLFDFEFCLPALDVQKQCVDQIGSVLGLLEQASAAAQVMLKDIDQLPSRLLAQAFNYDNSN